MKNYKRIIMLLAAMWMCSAGAWADVHEWTSDDTWEDNAKYVLAEDEVRLVRGTAEGEENTWTMTMPAADVELTAEYWPLATLSGTAAAAEGVATGEDEALVTGLTAKGGTLVWAVTACDVTTAPADDVFDAANNTAKGLTEAGDYRVWYYVAGDAEHSPTVPAYKDVTVIKASGFALSYDAATGLERVTFSVNGKTVKSANKDDVVTVTVRGVEGYAASLLTATAGSGSSATALTPEKTKGRVGVWTFTMPENPVNVTATMENVWGVSDVVDGTTEDKAYVISSTTGIDLLAENVNSGVSEYAGKYFKLGGDIEYSHTKDWNDATSTENNYTAIGNSDGTNLYYFKGHFDGCGHTVKGIRIYKGGNGKADTYHGLFGSLYVGGTVSHLTLDDARITGYKCIGGIVGMNLSGTITDCHVTATVAINALKSKASGLGGIVGMDDASSGNGIVEGCSSAATITGANNGDSYSSYGCIVGFLNTGTINNCIYLGTKVKANGFVGAIAGFNNSGTIKNCYFTNQAGLNSSVGYGNFDANTVGLARTITLEGDVAISGTAYDYAKTGTTPAVRLTTYTPEGGTAPTAMKYATADGKAWLFAPTGNVVGLSYAGPTGEGYWLEENITKTEDGSDLPGTVFANGTLTVPAYDVTYTATGEDVWGVSGDDPKDGSETKPYTITTPGGFKLLAKQVNGGVSDYAGTYFALGGDVTYEHTTAWNKDDSQENNYTAIACHYDDNNSFFFKGHFDGCGHTVKGIRIFKGDSGISNENYCQGLFGQIGEGGSVSHLTLDDARITGYCITGGIAGRNESGTITDCHVTATVCIYAVQKEACYHGGIVGWNGNNSGDGTVSGCTSRAVVNSINGLEYCYSYGGVVGYNYAGTIKDCLYLGGKVGGQNVIGAITGHNNGGTIENCYFKTLTDGSSNGNSTITPMDEKYKAIGNGNTDVTGKNVGYARTITLADDVALGGTQTNYAKEGTTPTQYLTAYATGDLGFALTLTKDGETTLYSVKDATVGIDYTGTLPVGVTPTFIVTKSQGGTVEVSSGDAGYSFLMPADDVSVSVMTGTNVEVAARSFATYCSSQAVSLADGQTGCALYTLSAVSNENVTLSDPLSVASAGTPLLVWNGSDTKQSIVLNFATAPATTTDHADAFKGTLVATDVTTLTDAAVYVLYKNMFVRTTTGSIPANKAYIALGTGSGARSLVIGMATGISLTPSPSPKGEGSIYSIDGRKVSDGTTADKLRKGVYIQDGRKVMMK